MIHVNLHGGNKPELLQNPVQWGMGSSTLSGQRPRDLGACRGLLRMLSLGDLQLSERPVAALVAAEPLPNSKGSVWLPFCGCHKNPWLPSLP